MDRKTVKEIAKIKRRINLYGRVETTYRYKNHEGHITLLYTPQSRYPLLISIGVSWLDSWSWMEDTMKDALRDNIATIEAERALSNSKTA